MDIINGRRVPPRVVRADEIIDETHVGTVIVEAGHLVVRGRLNGTLSVQPGTRATIEGKQFGSVSVGAGARVTVTGSIEGSTLVSAGGRIVVEPGGRLAGSLINHGLVVVRGVFGGAQLGEGEVRLEGEGYIKKAVIHDGANVYDW